jgi:transcriptional regulator with XRE-family HTH domain
MNFLDLQENLIRHIRERVHSGELTERGLARMTGISQPHIHNVLKGKRVLSIDAADLILASLHLDVRDLVPPADRK